MVDDEGEAIALDAGWDGLRALFGRVEARAEGWLSAVTEVSSEARRRLSGRLVGRPSPTEAMPSRRWNVTKTSTSIPVRQGRANPNRPYAGSFLRRRSSPPASLEL